MAFNTSTCSAHKPAKPARACGLGKSPHRFAGLIQGVSRHGLHERKLFAQPHGDRPMRPAPEHRLFAAAILRVHVKPIGRVGIVAQLQIVHLRGDLDQRDHDPLGILLVGERVVELFPDDGQLLIAVVNADNRVLDGDGIRHLRAEFEDGVVDHVGRAERRELVEAARQRPVPARMLAEVVVIGIRNDVVQRAHRRQRIARHAVQDSVAQAGHGVPPRQRRGRFPRASPDAAYDSRVLLSWF